MTNNLEEEMPTPHSRKRKTPSSSAVSATTGAADDSNNHLDFGDNNLQIPMPVDPSSLENNNNVTLSLSLQLHPPSLSSPPISSPPPTLSSPSLPSLLSHQSQIPYPYLHLSATSPVVENSNSRIAAVAPPVSPLVADEPPSSEEQPPPATVQRVGPTRVRRNPTQAPRDGTKSQNIPPPYPWATNKRAVVHTLSYLESEEIVTISGEVQCRRCEKQYTMDLDLREKFLEIASYMARNRSTMHDRAPANLMNPVLPTCIYCKQDNSVKPIISEKKKTINWLFLLLGRMLGCCTLEQLKYFCKHTKNHRTGAKDRVLYLTYLAICKQLDPEGPFDR